SAKGRGHSVEILDEEDNIIRITGNAKTEYIKQATKTSLDSYITVQLMGNKDVTKRMLQEQGIPTPRGKRFNNQEDALDYFDTLKVKSTVIKPLSTNFGLAVSTLISPFRKEEYEAAVKQAFLEDRIILSEDFIPGEEYRFLVIGDEVCAVLQRIPANVIGDGTSSVEELVHKKNQDPRRGHGYTKPLEKIRLGATEQDFLKQHNLSVHSIPLKGEQVFLRKNSNISTGGDSLDLTYEMPQGFKDLAVKAAKAVSASICGADIIIEDIQGPLDSSNLSVIELNFNPALHIHNYPAVGKNRRVDEKVLDLLGL
ncbi:MAG: hypothetical protein PF447_00285, partial [Spirochaetaceae bacterium]|nr:hypothetical protein [Spirochaetaceae bacterium]